jgi:hypothetical protein
MNAAGVVPADSALWRPSAARSNSAWLICERPALWRQTNSAVAIYGLRARMIAELACFRLGASSSSTGIHP